jgi:hypothetical protein
MNDLIKRFMENPMMPLQEYKLRLDKLSSTESKGLVMPVTNELKKRLLDEKPSTFDIRTNEHENLTQALHQWLQYVLVILQKYPNEESFEAILEDLHICIPSSEKCYPTADVIEAMLVGVVGIDLDAINDSDLISRVDLVNDKKLQEKLKKRINKVYEHHYFSESIENLTNFITTGYHKNSDEEKILPELKGVVGPAAKLTERSTWLEKAKVRMRQLFVQLKDSLIQQKEKNGLTARFFIQKKAQFDTLIECNKHLTHISDSLSAFVFSSPIDQHIEAICRGYELDAVQILNDATLSIKELEQRLSTLLFSNNTVYQRLKKIEFLLNENKKLGQNKANRILPDESIRMHSGIEHDLIQVIDRIRTSEAHSNITRYEQYLENVTTLDSYYIDWIESRAKDYFKKDYDALGIRFLELYDNLGNSSAILKQGDALKALNVRTEIFEAIRRINKRLSLVQINTPLTKKRIVFLENLLKELSDKMRKTAIVSIEGTLDSFIDSLQAFELIETVLQNNQQHEESSRLFEKVNNEFLLLVKRRIIDTEQMNQLVLDSHLLHAIFSENSVDYLGSKIQLSQLISQRSNFNESPEIAQFDKTVFARYIKLMQFGDDKKGFNYSSRTQKLTELNTMLVNMYQGPLTKESLTDILVNFDEACNDIKALDETIEMIRPKEMTRFEVRLKSMLYRWANKNDSLYDKPKVAKAQLDSYLKLINEMLTLPEKEAKDLPGLDKLLPKAVVLVETNGIETIASEVKQLKQNINELEGSNYQKGIRKFESTKERYLHRWRKGQWQVQLLNDVENRYAKATSSNERLEILEQGRQQAVENHRQHSFLPSCCVGFFTKSRLARDFQQAIDEQRQPLSI